MSTTSEDTEHTNVEDNKSTKVKKITLLGIARNLVKKGLLKEKDAQTAFDKTKSSSFVTYVVQEKLVDSSDVAQAAAEEFNFPLLDITSIELNENLIELVGVESLKKQLQKYKEENSALAIPIFKRGQHLYIAVSDPANKDGLKSMGFSAKMATSAIVVDLNKLAQTIEKAIKLIDSTMSAYADSGNDSFTDLDEGEEEEEKADTKDDKEEEEAPIVKFVHKMLHKAIDMGASDLHFEPYEKMYRVRFRVDGMLQEIATFSPKPARKLAARIKVMSRLDVSERRVPQDGRIKLKMSDTFSIDFRVSTCPTLWGEKIVMRILDSSAANLNIDILGYEEEQKRLYLAALANPYGMVLVTGPTGSGKTVSLYTGINILNTEGVNISTAEDPVEINLPGVNQVQIDEKTGMTFSKALKAFLRQDPDIILVGEIRDLETGGIAIKAATTGHMVMSTLHTNDAPQTLTRMIDMGIKPFAIATAVNLIMAQRLCRRLCKCKVEEKLPDSVLREAGFTEEDIPELKLYGPNPKGCDRCGESGYKGRVGIYQVMPISDEMKRLIMDGKTAIDLADQAEREGIPDLRKSGLKKAKDGLTSLAEVDRVTL